MFFVGFSGRNIFIKYCIFNEKIDGEIIFRYLYLDRMFNIEIFRYLGFIFI